MGILDTDWKFLNMLALQFLDNCNTQYNSVYLTYCVFLFAIHMYLILLKNFLDVYFGIYCILKDLLRRELLYAIVYRKFTKMNKNQIEYLITKKFDYNLYIIYFKNMLIIHKAKI